MKCPKCGYLGFERVDRCRNCGYDFGLISAVDTVELPLRGDAPDRQPLQDLAFLDAAMAPEPTPTAPFGPTGGRKIPSAASVPESAELPLFGAPIPDDLPLITRPSPPRSPLAVRRSTPEVPRLRSQQPRATTLDLALESPYAPTVESGVDSFPSETSLEQPSLGGTTAAVGARLAAFLTDLLILAAIDAGVLYFTMQICGVSVAELGILPRVPLIAFLVVQNGGYLVAFTAGGQTLGKMAAGIKVVADNPDATLDLGRAFIRELVWLALAVPAGLGLLTILSRDRRGIHDRFAGTRVVRV
jgi:uncharacterized RDD family membrane protein YckC